jgi:hypothetical protein
MIDQDWSDRLNATALLDASGSPVAARDTPS